VHEVAKRNGQCQENKVKSPIQKITQKTKKGNIKMTKGEAIFIQNMTLAP